MAAPISVNFGGASTTSGFTGAGIYTAIGIGARRLAANGLGPQIITTVSGYLGGRGGACTGTIYLGSSSLAGVSIPSAANGGTIRGPFNTSDWYVSNGATANYGFNATGGTNSFYFGRSASGTTYDTSGGTPWTGVAGGAYTYVQSPSAPGNLAITSTVMGEANVSWNHAGTGSPIVVGDDGGTAVTGSRLQYSVVETFGSGVTTVDLTGIGTITAHITGLTPGAIYYFRVSSKNAVTTAASTTSVWSATKSVFVMVDAATAYETLHPQRNAVTPLQNGAFWSLAGHGIGFDRNGKQIKPGIAPYTYNYYEPQSASYMTQQGNIDYNLLRTSNSIVDVPASYTGPPLDPFVVYPYDNFGDTLYANNIQYSSLAVRKVNSTYNSVYRMAYKTRLWYPNKNDWNQKDYFKHTVAWQGKPSDSFLFTGQQYQYTIDSVAQELAISVNYIDASGTAQVATNTVSLSPLMADMSYEFNVYVEYTYDSSFNYRLSVMVTLSGNIGTSVMAEVTYTAKRDDVYYTPVAINGVARDLYVTHSEHQTQLAAYEWQNQDIGYITNNLTAATKTDIGGPTLGVKMNGWEYLQAAAAASNMELVVNPTGEIVVRNTGENIVDITNLVPSVTLTPTTTFSGQQVEVQYNNAISVSASDATSTEIPESRPEEMYNAWFDDNRILEVKTGEILKITVNTKNYPLAVYNPTRVYFISDPVTGKALFTDSLSLYGQYSVSDSLNMLIGKDKFEAAGGKLEVVINPDIPNALDITLTAPHFDIPNAVGPYRLSISSGTNEYASLSILGYGLKTEPKNVQILTGSTASKTPQKVAKTIINPFIDTLERAYDQGSWAATEASGPKVSINGSIPTNTLLASGFGLNVGGIIKYMNSSYRIVELNIGNIETRFQATRFVRVDDFDTEWLDGTQQRSVGFHDGVWDGKEVQDEIVLSYYGTAGIDGVFIDIDTDGTPDITFNMNGAVGEYVLLFDTDGVPYYELIAAGQCATLLYLDTDFSPYYV
jgi:hypothetical protein